MANNNPLISVVLSNYNGDEYLAEAIESVLAQDYPNFEFIIVDDGSKDSSAEIINSYARKHSGIVIPILNKENEGQAEGFNIGIARSRGELVSFLDSDDLWFPNKLSSVRKHFGDTNRVAFHQHNLKLLHGDKLTNKPFRDFLVSGDYGNYADRIRVMPIFVPTSGLTFKRSVLDKVMPIPKTFRVCADGYMTRASLVWGQVSSTNEFCGAYRVHKGNSTFESPTYKRSRYLHSILLPAIFAFYKRHNVHWRFGYATDEEFLDSLSKLTMPTSAKVLMIRCAPPEIIEKIVLGMRKLNPSISIELMTQQSFVKRMSSLPVSLIPIGEGILELSTIGDVTTKIIRGREYDIGIIPYNSWHGTKYGNVYEILMELLDCPLAGVSTDGKIHPLNWKQGSWLSDEEQIQ